MENNNGITCVIVTYNRKQLLSKALQSINSQKLIPDNVIIIDNASTDNTESFIKEKFNFDNKHWFYIRSTSNLGGSAGFALGIAKAMDIGSQWISISDDDAIFNVNYFSALKAAMEEYPEQKIFSGSVVLPDGSHDIMHRERIINSKTLSVNTVPEEEYQHNFYYDIFSFVGVLLERSIIEKIGLPEKDYFIRFDDFEYAVRAWKISQTLNISDAVIDHETTYTIASISPWKEYYVMRNRILSLEKYQKRDFIISMYELSFLCRKCGAALILPSRRKQSISLIRAYFDGFNDGRTHRSGKNNKYLP